jgi:hypothetical protein
MELNAFCSLLNPMYFTLVGALVVAGVCKLLLKAVKQGNCILHHVLWPAPEKKILTLKTIELRQLLEFFGNLGQLAIPAVVVQGLVNDAQTAGVKTLL